MRVIALCLLLACPRGVDVTPESLDVFSAHRGVLFQSINLVNPSSSDVELEIEVSRASTRRLQAVPSVWQDSQNCARPSRLLARFRKAEGEGMYRRRLQEELRQSYASWRHLPRLDMEIVETCEPGVVMSKMRETYGPMLEFVEMDQAVYLDGGGGIPNDPDWPRLWGLEQIRMLEGWEKLTALGLHGRETVVAVIDTGLQLDHPDLKDSLWTNPGEIPGNGIDDDGNGYVDDIHGYDFAGEDGDPDDDNGHGTHCAGILAATANNGVGITGVASRLGKVRIMALRFIDADGHGGTVSDAVRALEYALSFGVPVSSSSWGGPDTSDALRVAIQEATQAGHLFVAAAGNSGRSIADGTYFPCVYRDAGVLCVAATDQSDRLTSFSNYASKYVEIAAPGIDIYSSYIRSGYRYEFGTSMSTPFVAGAAALVVSAFGYRGADVRQMLLDSSLLRGAFEGKVDGGRLDVLELIRLAEKGFPFWLDSDSGRSASLSVRLSANSSTSLRLQLGRDDVPPGTYEGQVSIRWADGQKTVPVTYRVDGKPELQVMAGVLEWPQVPVNAMVNQSLTFMNTGNGTGRVRLQRLRYPFLGPEDEIIIPPGAGHVEIGCAANSTGEWQEEAFFSTNSELDAFNASTSEALELGAVMSVSLKCVSKEPPHLEMNPVSGVAEVTASHLEFFQSVVHSEWEPFVPGGMVEADLVQPDANNSLGCGPHEDVAGAVLLVSRGGCYFVVKAQMASAANASGVVLYDSQDVVSGMPLLAMPRDADIPKIPMFMVTKVDGEALLLRLQRETIRVQLRWGAVTAYTLPSRPGRVSLSISNLGEATMRWRAHARPSFTAHSFYEALYPAQNGTVNFSWTHSGEDLGIETETLRPLPFNFSFYGETFEEVWVSPDGFLAFGSATSLRELGAPARFVAGFATNLTCSSCRISEATVEGCYTIQYANMSLSASSGWSSFEIQLCPDGRIQLMYAEVPPPPHTAFTGVAGLEEDLNLFNVLPFDRTPFAVVFEPWLSSASATHGVLGPDEIAELLYDVYSLSGQSGIIRVIGTDASGLWQTQRDLRLVQERFSFDAVAGSWGACLAEDCGNIHAGVRRRPLECHGMDGVPYDWDFCEEASCTDLVAEWRDKDGARCQEYEVKGWCLRNGSYGSGWKSNWGSFADFSFGGFDVLAVCCACGGGVRREPPHTEETCVENVMVRDTDCDGIIDCLDGCPWDPQTCNTSTSTASTTSEGLSNDTLRGASAFVPNLKGEANASGLMATAAATCTILVSSLVDDAVSTTTVASGSIWSSILLSVMLIGLGT